MKDRGLEIKVGALILGAVAVIAVFLVVLGNFSLARGYTLQVDFDYSGNIQAGAPVKVSGIKVGKVEDVEFKGGEVDPASGRHVQVRLHVWLEDRTRGAIHDNASFFINTAGVLGEQYLEIAPGGYDRPPLPPGSTVVGVDPPRTDLIVARLYEFLDSITTVLHDDRDLIARLLTSSTDLVTTLDEQLRANRTQIASLLGHADALSAEAVGLTAGLRQGVGDGTSIAEALANVDQLSRTLADRSPVLLASAQASIDDVRRVTSMVGPAEKADVDRALTAVASLSENVDHTTTEVAAIVDDIKSGRGTAGALLLDPEIYDDIKEMIRDLKKNPWKVLWKE